MDAGSRDGPHGRPRLTTSRTRAVVAVLLGWCLLLGALMVVPFLADTQDSSRLPSSPSASPIVSPFPAVPEEVWQSRGEVVEREPYDPPLPNKAGVVGQAWRAVYTSVSGLDGRRREVSGAFFVPPGEPPHGGWPVVSLAHGTTGIGHECGPAQQADLQGYAPIVEGLLTDGYAVALSDYEGLGPDGQHPYLEPRTAAFNVIDAVRALRELSPAVATRWVGLGHSQGGQSVWAASEAASFYGDGLTLLGSVALAPAANVTGVVDLAWSRSLTSEQRGLLPLLITGLARYSPEVDEDALLHGSAVPDPLALSRCAPAGEHATDPPGSSTVWRSIIERINESNDFRPATAEDAAAFRDALRRVALPQRAPEAPLLVITGERDALVLHGWVRSAVSDSCWLGGEVDFETMTDADHHDIVWQSSATVMRWIADRFAGYPAPSNCTAQRSPN